MCQHALRRTGTQGSNRKKERQRSRFRDSLPLCRDSRCFQASEPLHEDNAGPQVRVPLLRIIGIDEFASELSSGQGANPTFITPVW